MMKIIFLILLFISSAYACRNDSIFIGRRSGLSIGNGNHSANVDHKVSIPVRMNDRWGCWEQEGGLGFNVEEDRRTMTVILPKAKFKDIPGRTESYALISKDEGTLNLDIATFVCAGNTVLSAEAFSGTASEARILQSFDVQISTTFATGAAAAQLVRAREERARRFGRRTEMTGNLEAYFNEHFRGQWSALENYSVMVPTIFMGAQMRTPLSNLDASYSTVVLTKSACSPEFEAVMAPLNLKNLAIPAGVKAKLKRGNLELRW